MGRTPKEMSIAINKAETPKDYQKFRGERLLKRKLLGLCGRETVISVDRLADILCGLKRVDSYKEGKELVVDLCGQKIDYGYGLLAFEKLEGQRVIVRKEAYPNEYWAKKAWDY